jgi:CubicO group peptidase (beta-lactamase class C family)/D-alanyl-D-alanine dipeptidase
VSQHHRITACSTAMLLVAVCLLTRCLHAQNQPPRADYAAIATALQSQIEKEMADKKLPSLAIALVDDQTIVWSQGFGYEDSAHTRPATAHTIFRIGSVSKLFTDIAVMQMVEHGTLSLDAPVQTYLPDFHPTNPFATDITLRQLMSHRAGLLREPPVGHYFDDTSPSLAATVHSLNQTTLIAKPGASTKYSNAGVAAVGYVLEHTSHQPFADYLKQSVLQPLGMHESAFSAELALQPHMAEARMWSYDGLDFAAPTFPLGEAPAGAMYSSVSDLGIFLSALLAEGRGQHATILQPASLQTMWTPQFGGPFGLGFILGSLDGHREVAHNGAIYGFATELAALPDDKLGVVVITTMDSANAVTHHIAESALKQILARHSKMPFTQEVSGKAIDPDTARLSEGNYRSPNGSLVRLEESRDGLSFFRGSGSLTGLQSTVNGMVRESRLIHSTEPIKMEKDSLLFAGQKYQRVADAIPAEVVPDLKQFVGEFGWNFDKLYVFEDQGKLNILVEWFDFEPLQQLSMDVFKMPATGLYNLETVTFLRDASDSVTGVKIGSVTFKRLPLPADGHVFQITPVKPVETLRHEALASKPPVESGDFRKPELVQLNELDPTIKLDIRYATNRNFLGSPLYLQPKAYMQKPAAEAVARASSYLHTLGYGLLIHDSYRPWYVTKMFWEGTPEDKRIFVADPSQGSRHNRGCAVDLTLYDLKTGKAVEMTGGYDEMSERSYPFYPGGTSAQRWRRNLLRRAMEAQGFTVYEFEWWHFDYKDWHSYPILNLTFEQLEKHP